MYHYRISYLNLTLVWFCCIDITRLDIIKNLSILLSKTLHIFNNKKESKKWKINVQFLFVNWNLINQYEEDCLKSFGWHLKYFRWFVKMFPNIKLLCCSRYDLTWWLVAGSVAVCSWSIIECYCGLNVLFKIVISSHLQFLLSHPAHLRAHIPGWETRRLTLGKGGQGQHQDN